MAYGAIAAPKITEELPVFSYTLPDESVVTTHPVYGSDVDPALIDYACEFFNQELAEGKSYPQEEQMTRDAFIAYFFNSTTILAVVSPSGTDPNQLTTLDAAVAGRPWRECLGGMYYIKPNYPGRSSHNCNGGFLVPPVQRGRKIGTVLAKSYVKYAPKLGYRASVFNLVYKNNGASNRLWESLGFKQVGMIPGAGRLRTGPNGTEEYVDAGVYYKSFVDDA